MQDDDDNNGRSYTPKELTAFETQVSAISVDDAIDAMRAQFDLVERSMRAIARFDEASAEIAKLQSLAMVLVVRDRQQQLLDMVRLASGFDGVGPLVRGGSA